MRQDPRCASCYGPSLSGIQQEVLLLSSARRLRWVGSVNQFEDQFLQCPRRDNQPRHMNSDLKCTFSTPSSRSLTVQPPHVRTRSWARIHRITQEAARLEIRRTPASVDHPWLKPHYRHSECGSLFAMTYSSVLISHYPYWKFVCAPPTSTFTNTRSGVPICAQTREPYLVHRGTSDAALPKIFAQDHESLNQRSLWAGQPKEVMISINSTAATILPRKQLFLRQQLPPKLNFACSVDHNVNLDRICSTAQDRVHPTHNGADMYTCVHFESCLRDTHTRWRLSDPDNIKN